MKRNHQLKIGIQTEKEHLGTVKFIKSYYKKHKRFPSNKKIFTSIAAEHIAEKPNYYTLIRRYKL